MAAGDSLIGPPPLFHRDGAEAHAPGSCQCGKGYLSAYPAGPRFRDRACVHDACPASRCIGGTVELRCAHAGRPT